MALLGPDDIVYYSYIHNGIIQAGLLTTEMLPDPHQLPINTASGWHNLHGSWQEWSNVTKYDKLYLKPCVLWPAWFVLSAPVWNW